MRWFVDVRLNCLYGCAYLMAANRDHEAQLEHATTRFGLLLVRYALFFGSGCICVFSPILFLEVVRLIPI